MFCGNHDTFMIKAAFNYKSLTEYVHSSIYDFTVSFDLFNVSLLSINLETILVDTEKKKKNHNCLPITDMVAIRCAFY